MLLDNTAPQVHPIQRQLDWSHSTWNVTPSVKQRIQNLSLFFSEENLPIILFVVIILPKKINEALSGKVMPAKIRRHLKSLSILQPVDLVSNNNTQARYVSRCVSIQGKRKVKAENS